MKTYNINDEETTLELQSMIEEKGQVLNLTDESYLYTGFFPSGERVTFVIKKTEQGLKCIHSHCSIASDMKDTQCKTGNWTEQKVYQNQVQNTDQMQVSLDTIPGGIKISRDDDIYSFLYVSEELCKIFGYTKEEYLAMSQGNALGGIYPPDLPEVLTKISRIFENGGTKYVVKYRVKCKDGSLKWIIDSGKKVLDKSGNTIISSLYLDITESEKANQQIAEQKEQLLKEQERFRIAVENTSVIIFEYDRMSDTYVSIGTLEEAANKPNIERTVPDFLKIHAAEFTTEDSVPFLKELFHETEQKEVDMKIASYMGSKEFIWSRILVSPQKNPNGEINRIVGKITNIHLEKEKEFALIEAQSKDKMTGLYNKETGIRLVQKYMKTKQSSEVCCMMLLDMDNFKMINKQEGTIFADAILQEVADILRSETGPDDIQIRLGGDEFMLFIKNCDKDRATVLGPHIASVIRRIHIRKDSKIRISASIGMCVTAVVDEYSGLYRCAESTLKYVKTNGKRQAACYLDSSNELGTMLTQIYTESHFINSIDHLSENYEEDIVSFALELLGKSKNLDDALFLLIARIGRSCNLDRVSVLEINREYLSCQFTYQWAKQPYDLMMNHSFYFSEAELNMFSGLYNREGLSNISLDKKKGVFQSCLHAAIMENGKIVGALCFEKKEKGVVWADKQKKLIQELARIIASFILKAKADAISRAKTDFLSRMSHEIRTPMNAISGMTSIAKTVLHDPQKAMECLNKIESANEYLLSLINDILDMSRIESGKIELNLEVVDLYEHIKNLENFMRPQVEEKELTIAIENRTSLKRLVKLDSLRFQQIMVNIIGNAVKFTPKGGKITICMDPVEETPDQISVRFSVIDTGIGIAQEAMGRIFNAFEQAERDTTRAYGGTGLGLAISSHLVQMMGGKLEVESEIWKGSNFYFTLSLAYAPEKAKVSPDLLETRNEQKETDHQWRKNCRILLAEDNDLNLEIAQSLLEINDFVVETVKNGQEAVEEFSERPEFFYDAILMDIRMPVMDGLEAARQIRTMGRADSRNIPIIAMTANAFSEDMKKSLSSGMNGHLSKPIEIHKVIDMLWQCISQKTSSENTKNALTHPADNGIII